MKLYFPHIEGLRFVAAILVAIYHIWTDRISGGVDVFFVVSGLLITLSLLRQIDKTGAINPLHFFSGLALRLFPAALFVLALVLLGTYFLLPPTQHFDTVWEIIASILYYENWQLAVQSIDYLDRENPASPVQHFWAMSVQGQFYVYAALLVSLSILLETTRNTSLRNIAFFNAVAIVLSLAYSIYQTYFGDQIWAYFDTFARIWEFGLGAMLALVLSRNSNLALPAAFGWVGLAAILFCGLIFDVASVFPGIVALFPVLAAILVILGGRSQSRWSVQTLLGSRALMSLGSVSYGIYLVHWPLLVFYQYVTGERPNIVAGLALIGASVAFAYVIRRFVERPALSLKGEGRLQSKMALIASGALPLFAVAVIAQHVTSSRIQYDLQNLGTFALARPLLDIDELQLRTRPADFTPTPQVARRDRPVSSDDGCHANQQADELVWCTYGVAEGYTKTLAMVGGSHTAHWLPALELIAQKHNWKIIYSTWSACRFRIDHDLRRCRTLSRSAIDELHDIQPDLVFTSASAMRADNSRDRFATWERMGEANISVVAARGTPRFGFNVPGCLADTTEYEDCGVERGQVLSEDFSYSDIPQNVTVFDINEYFCSATYCPPTSDGMIMYFDGSHVTATYMRSLTEVIEAYVVPAMERSQIGMPIARTADGTP